MQAQGMMEEMNSNEQEVIDWREKQNKMCVTNIALEEGHEVIVAQ